MSKCCCLDVTLNCDNMHMVLADQSTSPELFNVAYKCTCDQTSIDYVGPHNLGTSLTYAHGTVGG
jgi:hypothetical protein